MKVKINGMDVEGDVIDIRRIIQTKMVELKFTQTPMEFKKPKPRKVKKKKGGRKNKGWTTQEITLLKRMFQENKSYSYMARELGRTKPAIWNALNRFKLKGPKTKQTRTHQITWDSALKHKIKRMLVEGYTRQAIAKKLGVSYYVVNSGICRFKLQKMK